ncbi:tRNA pseudouridine(13) synthase TruD [Thiomicrorhabdus sp. 6S2-11]|uniref:tRNA pseudouridine synthase D n=1 Tax=Thiomicrorhabdus marina TaxID=2818442 RepID=A0ABS3Q288_9GAMM|nr:tRNA pseudouridine(13) synthase TruD [Thiomicrorhabdus marina]MBO1926443.1 tRNA pseudouridine(13) synthase TruD [Thiomicrorhabdus marina]
MLLSPSSPVDFSKLAYMNGAPQIKADFKVEAEDFQVQEQHAYSLSGEGEHLWLYLQKTGENSEWMAKQVAKWAGVPRSAIGMAGQKDRHAVTQQWLSVHLPGKPDPDWSAWQYPQVELLQSTRHNRKLQTGGLSGNRFILRLRNLRQLDESPFAEPAAAIAELSDRLEKMKCGVPNYYGEQRFGKKGANVPNALRMLLENQRVPRNKRSIYLSALRSWAFNRYLSQRIITNNWNQYLVGDIFQLEGSSRCFADDNSEDLAQRLAEGDIHPVGLLIGEIGAKLLLPSGAALQAQQHWLAEFETWQQALSDARVKADHRALRLIPQDLQWQWQPNADNQQLDLQVEFTLPAGAFATMMLRELLDAVEPVRQFPQEA